MHEEVPAQIMQFWKVKCEKYLNFNKIYSDPEKNTLVSSDKPRPIVISTTTYITRSFLVKNMGPI